MILSLRVILTVYHILVCTLILIAVCGVNFSDSLVNDRFYFRTSSRLYIIWYISRILGYYFLNLLYTGGSESRFLVKRRQTLPFVAICSQSWSIVVKRRQNQLT